MKKNDTVSATRLTSSVAIRLLMIVAVILVWSLLGPFQPLVASLKHETSVQPHDLHDTTHWSYIGADGPDHWAQIQPEFQKCETGTQQSPINIQAIQHTDHPHQLTFDYQTVQANIIHTGHTIQAAYPSGSSLTYNGQSYQLRQFHFHHPGEHQFHAFSYPMEIHLVHQNATGHTLVVGIFVEFGEHNPAFGKWWDHMPHQPGKRVRDGLLNANDLLPQTFHHYSYHGSLTTPPCSQGVQWVILQTPITLSRVQAQTFTQTIGDNARPIQPLYGRHVDEE